MKGGKQLLLLLLLAASLLLVSCQERLQVSLVPRMESFFVGDVFTLVCGDSQTDVKWYHNDVVQGVTEHTWRIQGATPQHTGHYRCELNGQKSESRSIHVLDFTPSASLILKTGQPVMKPNTAVDLELHNKDGLQGWECRAARDRLLYRVTLNDLKEGSKSHRFQSDINRESEIIYWCVDERGTRSNQVIVRTSAKEVALEMFPMPAVLGKDLTVTCLAWGIDKSNLKDTTFYKDNKIIPGNGDQRYIHEVTESDKGIYKCETSFKNSGGTTKRTSDNQDLFLKVSAPMFVTQPVVTSSFVTMAFVVVVIVVLVVLVSAVYFIICYRRRNTTGEIGGNSPGQYEEVGMMRHPVQPGSSDQERAEGPYQPLRKEGMEDAVYHALGAGVPAGAEGGYEALRKEGMNNDEYQTLKE